MSAVLAKMPASWLIDVQVISNPGRDEYGDNRPSTTTTVKGCLLSPKSTTEEQNNSDVVDVFATLAMPAGTPIKSTDSVRTFEGAPVVGTWIVVGTPLAYPLGTEVSLRRESAVA